MAPTLEIPPGARTHRPITKTGLHHLPQEIGLLIYEFVLVEPPRWDKRHNIECDFKPENTEDPEEPPFVQTQVHLQWKRWVPKSTSPCSCARRKGLCLLQTCKAIHETASPIFWSQNTFCFLSAAEFIAVAQDIPSTNRDQIRDISIMNPDSSGHPHHVTVSRPKSRYMERFWEILTWFKSLEKLDMPAPYIEWTEKLDTAKCLNRLTDALPTLSTLQLNFLLPLSSYSNVNEYPLPMDEYDDHRVIYAGFSRRITSQQPGYWLPETVRELHRDLQLNFRIHVDIAVKTKFFGVDISNLDIYRYYFKPSPSLHESSTTRHITLPTGVSTAVKFYGLPITGKTKRARRRFILKEQRRENDERLDAAGKQAKEIRRQRKKATHDDELLDEQLSYQQELGIRERRLIEEDQAAKKSEKKKKKKVEKAMKAADESRKSERKRVAK